MTPYYSEAGIALYHGKAEDVLPSLPRASVDLIATDPPFYGVKDEEWDNQWDTPETFIAWIGSLCVEWRRVLKPNGSLYVFASPEMGSRVECEVRRHFNVLTNIRWRKPPFSTKAEMFRKSDLREYFPASEAIIFAEQYPAWVRLLEDARKASGLLRQDVSEHVVGTRSGACWNWEAGIRFPEAHHWEKLRDLFPTLPEYDVIERQFEVTDHVPYTDVWDFATVGQYLGKHPCEKPQSLMEHIVTASSRPSALVLDCFAGVGTTLRAAKTLGRRAIGVEQDGRWCRVTVERLAQGVLFAGEAT